MNALRPRRPLAALPAAALAFGLAAAAGARAEGFTGEEETLYALNQQRGPLALSADGRWVAHVDAGDTLHRTSLAEPSQDSAVPLGQPVRALAASRTAQKVAFATESGCLGVVDFGPGGPGAAAPQVAWRQVAVLADGRHVPDPLAWGPAAPAECGDFSGALVSDSSQIALSADGRLLATPAGVVDLDARRVVLARPHAGDAYADTVLRLRFLDHDAKLGVVTATLGEAAEGEGAPSGLQGAVWDLPTRALWSFAQVQHADLATPQGMFADVLPGGTLLWGDATRRAAAPAQSLPVDLVAWSGASCAGAPVRLAGLQAWQWQSLVVDPQGRWIAGMRKVERTGATDELVVADAASGRVLVERAFKYELHGLVAAADGSAVYGVSARSVRLPGEGQPPEPVGPASSVGEVIATPVPLSGLGPALAAPAWGARPCTSPDEAPDARHVERSERLLAPAWTMPLLPGQRPGSGGLAGASAVDCDPWCGTVFAMRDGSVWLDRGAQIEALDAGTGRVARTLPTPRSEKVDSLPVPAGDGFFNGQGDTLSWRPFDPAAGGPARRVVDLRPGYQVLRLERRGASVMAVWVRKPDARTPRDPEGRPVFDDAQYVLYDPSGKRLQEVAGHEQCGDACPADPLQPAGTPPRAPCNDERGPLTAGYDWRPGPFGSVRAYACGPAAGAGRLVFWDGVDATPRTEAATGEEPTARLVASDGALGVERAGNRLRVVDAAARRELGRVALAHADDAADDQVLVDAARKLLLVVSIEQEGDQRHVLRAYRIP